MAALPKINSETELLEFLTAEFAFCGCGYYEEAIRDLRDLLEFARRRQDSLDDADRFHSVTKELDEWLLRAPGLSTWIVWLLDDRDFIWHGKRTSDCYISDKGRLVLDSIDLYYSFDEAETENGG